MFGCVASNWSDNKYIYTQSVASPTTAMTVVYRLNQCLQTLKILRFLESNYHRSISTRKKMSVSTWNSYCAGHTKMEQSPTVIVLDTRAWIYH